MSSNFYYQILRIHNIGTTFRTSYYDSTYQRNYGSIACGNSKLRCVQ